MERRKKIISMVLATSMAVGMTACGTDKTEKSAEGENTRYEVKYDNTLSAEELEKIPSYQFVGGNLAYMISYGINLDVSLELKKDGTYELESKFYNQGESSKAGDPEYVDIHTNASGTYTLNGDEIQISAAEVATAVYEGGQYITEQGMFLPFSFNEDGTVGTWSSEDVPKVLECVPETIFTVSEDGKILSWKAAGTATGNPNESVTEEAEQDEALQEENTEQEMAEFVAAYTMYATDTESIYMEFAEDGTYIFNFSDYNIVEEGTWQFANGVLTVTNENGVTAESVINGEEMTLLYVSAASDQLVGNFAADDWSNFFENNIE